MRVIVLMSSYNGELYIEEQIESILNQTIKCELVVRDDGSKDKTIEILKKYESAGKLKWYSGINVGPCQSFFDLIKNADEADYYALSDQDDYWDCNKLEVAISALEREEDNLKLYFCKRRIVDKDLNELNVENTYVRSTSPRTALIEGIAYGCTMVFNEPVKELIQQLKDTRYNYMHDAFIYRLVSLCGTVIYDEGQYISYRQHGNNVVGHERTGFSRWIERFRHLPNRRKSTTRSECAKDIYNNYKEQIKPEYIGLVKDMANVHTSMKARIKLVTSDGLMTQHPFNVIFLKFFILLGWL